jgi:gamma-glutamyltranspeptidase/glutathione hydrolase
MTTMESRALAAWAPAVVLAAACAIQPQPAARAPEGWRFSDAPAAVVAPHVMVVSEHPFSSDVGAEIMRRGGNAIDAAVAVGFAQAVVNPGAGNIGGGGFLVYRQADGQVFALDFRETAPGAASRDMYLDSAGNVTDCSRTGALSAGVPGSVAGLWEMHGRFGRLPWREVVAPAVALARGHVLDAARAGQLVRFRRRLARFPSSADVFVRTDRPWQSGDVLGQPDLARTLERIAEGGSEEFYGGLTADLILAEMGRSGGLITREDLAGYRALWREPLSTTYRGWRVYSMAPSSGGGATLIQALNILEGYRLPAPGNTATLHLEIEALRRAFLDRNALLGDPAFVRMPLDRLTSTSYAAEQRRSIRTDRATPLTGSSLAEGPHTTHYSVVDGAGNAAAVTTTLNEGFGSALVVGGAGFLLNDEMDDFTARPGAVNAMGIRQMGEANTIVPGKRMLSSMSPTIVLDPKGRLALVLGSPGGPTIVSAVLQVISNVIDHRMSLAQAVAAPRIHHNGLPDVVNWEPGGTEPAVRSALTAMGHVLGARPEYLADVNAIRATSRGLEGVSDPRAAGGASGW